MKRKISTSLRRRSLKNASCSFLFLFVLLTQSYSLKSQSFPEATCIDPMDLCFYELDATNASCMANQDGQISLTTNGSDTDTLEVSIRIGIQTPFREDTVLGATEVVFDNLEGGINYIVEVSSLISGNTCSCSKERLIEFEPPISIAFVNVEDVRCNGESNGSATAAPNPTGGTYSYEWSNGETTATALMLDQGSNTVTLTDVNTGCEVSNTLVINEPDPITFSINPTEAVSCFGIADGIAAIFNVNGGTGAYTYFLDGSMVTGTTYPNLAAGIHTIEVRDANNCSLQKEFTIDSPDEIVNTEQISNVLCNGELNGAIVIDPVGGTNTYTYNWSTGATSKDLANLAANTYSVTITDGNGCTFSVTYEVMEPDVLVVDAFVEANVSCTGLSLGMASSTVTGGTLPYNLVWSTGSTQQTIDDLDVGNYSIGVTDANACSGTDEVFIFMEENPLIVGLEDVTVANGEVISQTFSSNSPFVIFHWEITGTSNIDTANPDYLASGSVDANAGGELVQTFNLLNRAEPGTLDISVYPQSGDCIGDTLTAQFIIEADDIPSYIPDLITPNGDGSNDSWKVVFPTGVDPANVSVVIYNRAGGKVYEGNMAEEWQAQNCPDGVYFYRLSSSDSPDFFEEGAVSVLRKL